METERSENIIQFGRIFSIRRSGVGFIISEECDGYYQEELTREDVVVMCREIISFVGAE